MRAFWYVDLLTIRFSEFPCPEGKKNASNVIFYLILQKLLNPVLLIMHMNLDAMTAQDIWHICLLAWQRKLNKLFRHSLQWAIIDSIVIQIYGLSYEFILCCYCSLKKMLVSKYEQATRGANSSLADMKFIFVLSLKNFNLVHSKEFHCHYFHLQKLAHGRLNYALKLHFL